MDTINCEYKELSDGGWGKMPFSLQMGNLGSEVSRSLKWFGKFALMGREQENSYFHIT